MNETERVDENRDDERIETAAPASRVAGVVDGFRERKLQLAVVLGGALLAGLAIWTFTGDEEELTPPEAMRMALEMIDKADDLQARAEAARLARSLLERGYRDPDFAGGAEYVLGIAHFREAEESDDALRERKFLRAVRYLKECERHALSASRRPEWSYALGMSLYRVGTAADARPYLEEAVASYPRGRTKATLSLTDILMDLKTPKALNRALELNSQLLENEGLSRKQKDRAYLQRAHVALLLDEGGEAERALAKISRATSDNQGTVIFRAQTLMAEERYQEAIEMLTPVAQSTGLEQRYPRQANYLIGVCAENLGQTELAITSYRRTAKKYAKSQEGLAASLLGADLLRRSGRNEEALESYRRALAMVERPENLRNRWISLKEFRKRISDARDAWVAGGSYSEAIKLARMMPPLIDIVKARRLEAAAHESWAEHIAAELAEAPYGERDSLEKRALARWAASGEAFKRLADALRDSDEIAEAVWTSAAHFRKGYKFQEALDQLTIFINLRPKRLMAAALVRRGEVLMDLRRFDEALESFRRVISTHTTDPAWFEARYLVGRCHLERDELQQAEKAWRRILDSDELTPAAREWRLSLLSLGMLLYHTAHARKTQALGPQNADDPDRRRNLLDEAYARWDEAIVRLNEYLVRYPGSEERLRARFFLAKALQRSADRPRNRLEAAETKNAKEEIRRTIDDLLRKAVREFRTLQSELLARDEGDQLDTLGRRMLRDCYYEIAHTYYALEDYSRAIVAYHGAANRYPQDPHVLLAYLQMTNCNEHLGRPDRARSMLEQAKVILKQMPEENFDPQLTNLDRQEWEQWLQWASRLQRMDLVTRPAP